MNIGLCTISRRTDPLAEVAAQAAAAGCDGIELWGQPPHLPELTGKAGTAAREIVLGAGLEPAAYGSYLRAGVDGFADQLAGVLAAAEGFSAPLLRVWAGGGSDAEASEAQWQQCLDDLARLLDSCGERRVVVERHSRTLTESLAGAERLLTALDDPRLNLCFQYLEGHDTAETVREMIALWPRIGHVHAQSYGASGPSSLAAGRLDYREILGTLRSLGYLGYVEVEFVRRADGTPPADADEHRVLLAADVAYLRACLD